MLVQIKLPLEWVDVYLTVPIKRAEAAMVRQQVLDAVGKEFDQAVIEAKKQWKNRAK